MKTYILQEIQTKMEHYCAYQERCYKEVEKKLYTFNLIVEAREKILIHLIENDYINEERFAKSFARGKHNYKFWGRIRIAKELRFRNISERLITIALNEISNQDYNHNFHSLAEKKWETITAETSYKKEQKWIGFLLRKGYENSLVYEKLHDLRENI